MREKDIIDRSKYQFTRNWFIKRNRRTFLNYVVPEWGGKPITYLELGVFEGMSMVWMMQYVLTHPESRAVGVDPWLLTCKLSGETMEAVRQRAFHNVSEWGDRCKLIRGNSDEVLRRMVGRWGFTGVRAGTVDLCMVDGNHNALAVWSDARWVYRLLRVGGQVLFDDVENDIAKENHVKQGLQMFLTEIGGKMKLLWKHGYMECYAKVS